VRRPATTRSRKHVGDWEGVIAIETVDAVPGVNRDTGPFTA
jgi:hypothetical protein